MRTLPEVVLKDAAAYIERHGWLQGDYSNHEGRVCILGALRAVKGVQRDDVLIPECNVLRERTGCHSVHEWNDAPFRTLNEVLAALRGDA